MALLPVFGAGRLRGYQAAANVASFISQDRAFAYQGQCK